MTRWFWTSAVLCLALVGVVVEQQRIISNIHSDEIHAQFLLEQVKGQLNRSAGIISQETWMMVETVDLQAWERVAPGYLDFYTRVSAELRDLEEALLAGIAIKSPTNWRSFFYLYQEAKDHIPAYFSEFEYNHGHKLGRSESEIQQSSWSKYIQGFFLSDFELLTFKESIIEYSDFLQAWLENHIAELAYEVNLQTVALGCQRYYIPNISPQVTFPQTSIQQGDSHKALVSVVYRLENLNPTYDFLVVNGDTLTLDQNGTAGFLIPSEERGRQDLEVSFYGLDPFAKRMEESTILYSYEVLEKE